MDFDVINQLVFLHSSDTGEKLGL